MAESSEATEGAPLCSIGELSAQSGISPHTLRVWERRYGRPTAVRLPSGHRRYPQPQVDWTCAVAELLSFGHRPGKLMALGDGELRTLLDEERGHALPDTELLDALLEAVRLDGPGGIRDSLHTAIEEFGPRRAIHEFVAPLTQLVGQRWSEGMLDVRHEHLITEVVLDVLRATRLRLAESGGVERLPGGPHLILATLAGERHGLGLEMVHLLAEISGLEVLLLGVDLPVEEIAQAAAEHPGAAVGLSVSRHAAGTGTERALAELRRLAPSDAAIVVGGQGALVTRRRVQGVDYCTGLAGFEDWLRGRFPAVAG